MKRKGSSLIVKIDQLLTQYHKLVARKRDEEERIKLDSENKSKDELD
jgi:hypothetical protein